MKEDLYLYIRVSTEIQQTDGFGLENQKELGYKVSERLKMNPILINEGSQSSSKDDLENRPKLTKLLEDVERGRVKNIWVFRVDRLSRNDLVSTIINKKLEDNKVTLWVGEGTKYSMDDLQSSTMLKLFNVFSSFDQKMRTDRLRRGRLSSVSKGGWKGGPPTYGYKVIDKKLVVDEEESKWVKRIYKEYGINGKSIYEIKNILMRNGVKSRRGNILFSELTIRNMLVNTTYEGYSFYTDKQLNETITYNTPIIIEDKTLLKKVKERINKQRYKSNTTKRETLFGEYFVCKHCKSPFGQKINPKQYYNHYYCRGNEIHKRKTVDKGKLCKKDGGRVRSLNIEETDKFLWNEIIDTLFNSHLFREFFKDETLTPIYKERKLTTKDKNSIRNRIKSLEKDIRTINDVIEENIVNSLLGEEETYKGVIKKLKDKRSEFQNNIEELTNELVSDMKKGEYIDWYLKFKNKIEDLKDTKLNLKEKKEFLKGVLDKVIVETIDNQTHKLEIVFNNKFVGGDLIWKDSKQKSLGYDLVKGTNRKKVPFETIDKRTLPKKKSLD